MAITTEQLSVLEEILEDSAAPNGGGNANGIPVTEDQLELIADRVLAGNADILARYQAAIHAKTDFTQPVDEASAQIMLEEVQAIIDDANLDLSGLFEWQDDFNDPYVADWDVSGVTDMERMFDSAESFNQDIGGWDVSNVKYMTGMFGDANAFNQDIGDWNVSNVEDMAEMFVQATLFNQNISNWDVSSVNSMESMFDSAINFNQDIGDWDVSSVEKMSGMFFDAGSFNQDIGDWDVSSVEDMRGMFNNANAFDQNLGKWDISSLTYATEMFQNSGMSQENFDKLLVGWSTLDITRGETNINNNVELGADGLTYADLTAFNRLATLYNWNITDATLHSSVIAGTSDYETLGDENATDSLIIHALDDDDELIGGQADDVLVGGAGNDLLTGNAGSDRFVYKYADDGNDVIADFNINEDILDLSDLLLGLDPQDYDLADYISISESAEGKVVLTIDRDGNEAGTELVTITLFNIDYADIDPSTFLGTLNIHLPFSDALDEVLEDSAAPNGGGNANGIPVTEDQLELIVDRVLAGNADLLAFYQAAIHAKTDFTQPVDQASAQTMLEEVQALIDNANLDLSYLFDGQDDFNDPYVVDWDVSGVTNMEAMFIGAESFSQDIGGWDVSRVISMKSMFDSAISFNQDIGDWDVSSVKDMAEMFVQATSFNQDIGDWDVSNVEDMRGMFFYAESFNQDISGWDVSNVNSMESMFESAISFNQDIGDWDVSIVKDMSYMFDDAQSFDQDIGDWDISSLTSARIMFRVTSMSQENFDKLLAGWSTLDITRGETAINYDVDFGAYGLTYTDLTAFNRLASNYSWTVRGATLSSSVTRGTNDADTLGVENEVDQQIIHALNGDDTLIGGSADDVLVGGAGDDLLAGYAGADRFVFKYADDGNDTILDFDVNEDILDLSDLLLGITYQHYDLADYISVSESFFGKVVLTIDRDGNEAGSELVTITLDNINYADIDPDNFLDTINLLYETNIDWTEGGDGNDTLTGTDDADTIYGLDGKDQIKGGKGADIINGGRGYDTINGNKGADVLSGNKGDDKIYGGKGADKIYGGKGDDKIYGGNGADTLKGGLGSDIINGGNGTDIAVFEGNYADYDIADNGDGSFEVTHLSTGDIDTLTNIESLTFDDQDYPLAA